MTNIRWSQDMKDIINCEEKKIARQNNGFGDQRDVFRPDRLTLDGEPNRFLPVHRTNFFFFNELLYQPSPAMQ